MFCFHFFHIFSRLAKKEGTACAQEEHPPAGFFPGPPSLDQLGTIDVSSHHPWRRPRLGSLMVNHPEGPPQLWLKLQLWREKPVGHVDLNGYFYGVNVPYMGLCH